MDKMGSVYVADSRNHRVMRWDVNASEGVLVAGGNETGNQTDQLSIPGGIVIDDKGTIFVVDEENHRVMSVPNGTINGTVIAGGHGDGTDSNQLGYPISLTFNNQGDLYVSDFNNFRVQMFAVAQTPTSTPSSGGNSDYFCRRWATIICFLSFMISIAF